MGKKARTYERYAPELKQRAIALAREIGGHRAGAKLGISGGTLNKWILHANRGGDMKKDDTPEKRAAKLAEREIQRLKRENEELKKANYILKEVASFFSKDRSKLNLKRSNNSSSKKVPK